MAESNVMHAAVQAVDDEADALAEFVRQTLANHPADNRRRRMVTV
jgi:hypothetical protein